MNRFKSSPSARNREQQLEEEGYVDKKELSSLKRKYHESLELNEAFSSSLVLAHREIKALKRKIGNSSHISEDELNIHKSPPIICDSPTSCAESEQEETIEEPKPSRSPSSSSKSEKPTIIRPHKRPCTSSPATQFLWFI